MTLTNGSCSAHLGAPVLQGRTLHTERPEIGHSCTPTPKACEHLCPTDPQAALRAARPELCLYQHQAWKRPTDTLTRCRLLRSQRGVVCLTQGNGILGGVCLSRMHWWVLSGNTAPREWSSWHTVPWPRGPGPGAPPTGPAHCAQRAWPPLGGTPAGGEERGPALQSS